MSHKVEVFWLEECNKCGHNGQVSVTDDYAEDCVAYAVWNDANLPSDVAQSLKEVS